MKEYFKTDAKQFAFRPKTFSGKQQTVRIRNVSQKQFQGAANDCQIVKLDENKVVVCRKDGSGFMDGQNANIWLLNLKEKTLNLVKPPKTYPSGQEQTAKTAPVNLGFCKLENEILAFCGASNISVCVLKGDGWEFITPNISFAPSAGCCYGGLASGNAFYDYADGGLKYNNNSSSDLVTRKVVPIKKALVNVSPIIAGNDKTNLRVFNKTGVQGLFCPVDLETGWIEGNTHYAFDGENLVITEFIQDNVIEIKE
jgi:hypothetical protein|nr:hypothetical protein [uncultured Campylobacter sp.]